VESHSYQTVCLSLHHIISNSEAVTHRQIYYPATLLNYTVPYHYSDQGLVESHGYQTLCISLHHTVSKSKAVTQRQLY
jgi:hypothetical protein